MWKSKATLRANCTQFNCSGVAGSHLPMSGNHIAMVCIWTWATWGQGWSCRICPFVYTWQGGGIVWNDVCRTKILKCKSAVSTAKIQFQNLILLPVGSWDSFALHCLQCPSHIHFSSSTKTHALLLRHTNTRWRQLVWKMLAFETEQPNGISFANQKNNRKWNDPITFVPLMATQICCPRSQPSLCPNMQQKPWARINKHHNWVSKDKMTFTWWVNGESAEKASYTTTEVANWHTF